MTDIYHYFGTDLAFGANGDLVTASGTVAGQQEVLRRLLTNPGDDTWNPTFGAGLGQFIGQAGAGARIFAAATAAMLADLNVSQTPSPTVDVRARADGVTVVNVSYADAATGEGVTLQAPVQ